MNTKVRVGPSFELPPPDFVKVIVLVIVAPARVVRLPGITLFQWVSDTPLPITPGDERSSPSFWLMVFAEPVAGPPPAFVSGFAAESPTVSALRL